MNIFNYTKPEKKTLNTKNNIISVKINQKKYVNTINIKIYEISSHYS